MVAIVFVHICDSASFLLVAPDTQREDRLVERLLFPPCRQVVVSWTPQHAVLCYALTVSPVFTLVGGLPFPLLPFLRVCPVGRWCPFPLLQGLLSVMGHFSFHVSEKVVCLYFWKMFHW